MKRITTYIQRCIMGGILLVVFSSVVCFADPPSIIKKSINASGYCPVNDNLPFRKVFVNLPVMAMGNMPSANPHASSYHTYTIDTSEYHNEGESIRSEYGVGLQPWWSGIFMLLGGGADGWTAEETDFSSYSTISSIIDKHFSRAN